MLRITDVFEDEQTISLRLDGRVDETTVAELEESILQHRNGKGKRITLDFAGIVFINDVGVDLLRKIKDDRIRIVNCSLYVKSLLGDLIEENN